MNLHPCSLCENKEILDFMNFRQNRVLDFRYKVAACYGYILQLIIKSWVIQHNCTFPNHYGSRTCETHTLRSVLIYYKYQMKDAIHFIIFLLRIYKTRSIATILLYPSFILLHYFFNKTTTIMKSSTMIITIILGCTLFFALHCRLYDYCFCLH